MAAVPTLWIQLMQRHSPFSQMAFPKLRYITNSGGVFPVDLVAQLPRASSHTSRIYLMYGLSEAFRSTYLPPEELDRRPGSMGKAIPETEILVIDEHGRECGPDEVGELVHAGPTVALGYWNRPPEVDGRGLSRPPAAPGSTGARRLFGRSGEQRRRGLSLLRRAARSADQEPRLSDQPGGSRRDPPRLGACGGGHRARRARRDRRRGDCGARGPADAGHVHSEALLGYCQDVMPRYMVPRRSTCTPSLPRTSSGKVDRAAVRV